jgi:hypothetical protein
MSENILNPLWESLYFAYLQALMKKHGCSFEEAQAIAKQQTEGNHE